MPHKRSSSSYFRRRERQKARLIARNFRKRKKSKSVEEAKEELRDVFVTAFRDKEKDEVVSTKKSKNLDLWRGEVLRQSKTYVRKFWFE